MLPKANPVKKIKSPITQENSEDSSSIKDFDSTDSNSDSSMTSPWSDLSDHSDLQPVKKIVLANTSVSGGLDSFAEISREISKIEKKPSPVKALGGLKIEDHFDAEISESKIHASRPEKTEKSDSKSKSEEKL